MKALQAEEQGDLNRAVEYLDKYLSDVPKEPTVLAMKGACLLRLSRFQEACDAFSIAISLTPDRADFYRDRSTAYQALQQYEKSLSDINFAISREPDNVENYRSRALLYGAMKSHGKAVKDLDLVLARTPRDALAYAMRGASYEQLEDYPRALADLETVVRLLNDGGLAKEAQEFEVEVERLRSKLPKREGSVAPEQVTLFRTMLSHDYYARAAQNIPQNEIVVALVACSDGEIANFLRRKQKELFGGKGIPLSLSTEESKEIELYQTALRAEVFRKMNNSESLTIDEMVLQVATPEQLFAYRRRLLER
jgi:tetratricopeptide (TPR) repeat protein